MRPAAQQCRIVPAVCFCSTVGKGERHTTRGMMHLCRWRARDHERNAMTVAVYAYTMCNYNVSTENLYMSFYCVAGYRGQFFSMRELVYRRASAALTPIKSRERVSERGQCRVDVHVVYAISVLTCRRQNASG